MHGRERKKGKKVAEEDIISELANFELDEVLTELLSPKG